MKRRMLLRHLGQNGCSRLRDSQKHSVYWNPTSQRTTAVPRQREKADVLAAKICKDLGIPIPQ
jgi:hypothetical protein